MRVLYNDNEPEAVAWLWQLMSHGEIPVGVVDERSICDIDSLDGRDECHLFAGIGGWPLALRWAGWPSDLGVWTGSCPCPPFSSAGRKKCAGCGKQGTLAFYRGPESCIQFFGCWECGYLDERHLWPEMFRLIRQHRPPVIFGEQVASKDGLYWLAGVRADLESCGYAVGGFDLPAAGVGAPHIRQRLFWVAESDGKSSERVSGGLHPPQEAVNGARVSEHGPEHLGSANGGEVRDRVADAEHGRPGQRDGGQEEAAVGRGGPSDDRRVRGGLGHSVGVERNGGGHQSKREPQARVVVGGPGKVGDGSCDFCGYGFDVELLGKYGCPNCGGDGLGDAVEPRLEGHAGDVEDGDEPGRVDEVSHRPTPETGWDRYDIVRCVEPSEHGEVEKFRRVEPGTFPLAHGVPGRVGLLRGYGNAIVPQVAAEVIAAYMAERGIV